MWTVDSCNHFFGRQVKPVFKQKGLSNSFLRELAGMFVAFKCDVVSHQKRKVGGFYSLDVSEKAIEIQAREIQNLIKEVSK